MHPCYRKASLLGENSRHTLRDKGPLSTEVPGQVRLAAITVTPEWEILLTYVCVRIVHSTNAVTLKSLSGSAQVTLQQFNQRQETARLATWAGWRFTQQRYCMLLGLF